MKKEKGKKYEEHSCDLKNENECEEEFEEADTEFEEEEKEFYEEGDKEL